MSVYVVLAGYAYDSDWVVGVTSDLDTAKATAKAYLNGAEPEWGNGSSSTYTPDGAEQSIWASCIGLGAPDYPCDTIMIQRWKVAP